MMGINRKYSAAYFRFSHVPADRLRTVQMLEWQHEPSSQAPPISRYYTMGRPHGRAKVGAGVVVRG